MERMTCSACRDTTQERCSYCLLPVCEQHGRWVTACYTSRQVLVCAPCQERLREIAREEQALWVTDPASVLCAHSLHPCVFREEREH